MNKAEYVDMIKYLDYTYVDNVAMEQQLSKHVICFDITPLANIRPSIYKKGIILTKLGLDQFTSDANLQQLDTHVKSVFDNVFIINLIGICLSKELYDKTILYPMDMLEEVRDYIDNRYRFCLDINADDLSLEQHISNYIKIFKDYLDKLLLGYIDYTHNAECVLYVGDIDLAGLFYIKDIDFYADEIKSRGILVVNIYYKPIPMLDKDTECL